ncbi:MAG: ThuA domain-containing protein [Planctomycetota bacterium]
MPINVTVWHEYHHEHKNPTVAKHYPDGMHVVMKSAIEEHLGNAVNVTTATQEQDENHGLSDELLAKTDVMTWWGHARHGDVKDEIVEKVVKRVWEGMGLVVLHSGHYSKPFKRLMGTGCGLKWREAAEKERLWCVSPGHPVTVGLEKDYIELPQTEMYGEHFDVPEPDETAFISWFEGGEVFRSGMGWKRGAGKVFYFRPGHETFPIYHNPEVRRVLANMVDYVKPHASTVRYEPKAPNIPNPLSPIAGEHEVDASMHDNPENK